MIALLMLCNKAHNENGVSKAQYDALATRVKDTANYYRQMLNRRDRQADSAAKIRGEVQQQLNKSNAKVTASQATINRLVARIERARSKPADDTWVKVHPDYKEGCDSLVVKVKQQEGELAQRDTTISQLNELMLYEISQRDSTINAQKDFNQKFASQLEDCMAQLHAKVNAKQRNQVYAGIGLFGNQINPLAGGQVNVSLRTRGNKIYEVTGATVGNTWYAGVGTKILISFRK